MQASLWQALGGRLSMFNEFGVSQVELVLQKSDFTLEEVLEQEDLLQEAKFCNSTLMDYLSTRAIVEQLVNYTIAPSAEAVIAISKAQSIAAASSEATTADSSAIDASINTSATSVINDTIDENAETSSDSAAGTSTASSTASSDSTPATAAPSDDSTPSSSTLDSTTAASSVSEADHSDSDDDLPPLRDDADSKSSDGSSRHAHKFPYLASELLSLEISSSILDVLVEDDTLLTNLFSILDRPAPLDPATVSYFRKVLQVLIQRKYQELVHFCETHGILDKLLRHLGLYSIMELVIMIGWDSGLLDNPIDQSWMLNQSLIPKLVRKLHPSYELLPDVHAHAGRLLVDVVVKAPLTRGSPLVEHLQTTPILQALMSHLFSGCSSSLSNSLSVIIVLVQRYANRRLEQLDQQHHALVRSDDSNDDPFSLSFSNNYDHLSQPHDFTIASGDNFDGCETIANLTKSTFESTPSNDPEVIKLGEPFISLLPHLKKILDILLPDNTPSESASSASSSSQTVVGVLGSASFGSLRMKVVELCLVLARSRSPLIDATLSQLGVADTMLRMLIEYPWNNLLHGLVESIVTSSLEDPDSHLTRAFFTNDLLLNRLVEGWEKNAAIEANGGMRLGYMGHLIRTGATVNNMLHAAMSDRQREVLLPSNSPSDERWNAFVSKLQLELIRQQLNMEDNQGGDANDGFGANTNTLGSSYMHQDLQDQQEHDLNQFVVSSSHQSSASHYLDDDDSEEEPIDNDNDDEVDEDDFLDAQHSSSSEELDSSFDELAIGNEDKSAVTQQHNEADSEDAANSAAQ